MYLITLITCDFVDYMLKQKYHICRFIYSKKWNKKTLSLIIIYSIYVNVNTFFYLLLTLKHIYYQKLWDFF